MASVFTPKPHNPCAYCGSSSYGEGCRISPSGRHYHPNDPKTCRFCGAVSRGKGCRFNPPTGLHVLGMGGTTCVYCGSPSKGKGCQLNPIGIHDPVGSEQTPLPANFRAPATSVPARDIPSVGADSSHDGYDPETQESLNRAGGSMRQRCGRLLKDKQHIALQIAGAVIFAGFVIWFSWQSTSNSTWRLVWTTLAGGVAYWFRNVFGVIVKRSYLGLPAACIGLGVRQWVDVDVGNALMLGAVVLWVWPVWPFAVLLLLAFAAAAPAMSKASGHKLYPDK